jgi:Tfp pilus assembly protein PilZ
MDERRREARFDVETGHGTMLSTSPVEILNMSLGGLAFRTETRLQIGEEYTVTLDVAGKTVKVRGIVAWSVLGGLESRGGETVPVYSVGMKFHGPLSEAEEGFLDPVPVNAVAVEQRLAGVRFHLDGQASIAHPLRYTVRVISMHGMLIEIDHPMKVDEVLPLEVSLEDEDTIHARGRVASCHERLQQHPKHYDIGFEFMEMAPEDRERLARVVKALSKKR